MGYLVGGRLAACKDTTKTLRTASHIRRDSWLDPRALSGQLFDSAKPPRQQQRQQKGELRTSINARS